MAQNMHCTPPNILPISISDRRLAHLHCKIDSPLHTLKDALASARARGDTMALATRGEYFASHAVTATLTDSCRHRPPLRKCERCLRRNVFAHPSLLDDAGAGAKATESFGCGIAVAAATPPMASKSCRFCHP